MSSMMETAETTLPAGKPAFASLTMPCIQARSAAIMERSVDQGGHAGS